MEQLSNNYGDNVAWFNETLGVGRSMDIVSRDYCLGGRRARIWVVDGFGQDGTLERMGAFWLGLAPEQVRDLSAAGRGPPGRGADRRQGVPGPGRGRTAGR